MTAWRVVPVEPTREMIEAGNTVSEDAGDIWEPSAGINYSGPSCGLEVWEAMLAAAPKPPPYEPSEAEVEAAAEAGYATYRGFFGDGAREFHDRGWREQREEFRERWRATARAALVAADKARQEGK